MVNLAIAPVGFGTHGLEKTAAAECGIKTEASGFLHYKRDPGVCIWKEDHIGVMDLDEL